MPSRNTTLTANLLENETLGIEEVLELANTLSKIHFPTKLANGLYKQKKLLEIDEVTPSQYINSETVQSAKAHLEQYLHFTFTNALKLWWNAPHQNFTYENLRSIIAFISFITFTALTYSFNMFFLNGKNQLKDSGASVADLCTGSMTSGGAILVAHISDQIAAIPVNGSLTLDMTRALVQTPSLNIINSFMPPLQLGWFIFAQFLALEKSTEMTGNLYISDSQSASQYFQNGGFPIAQSSVAKTGIPSIDLPLLNATISSFLLDFCLIIDKGGRGLLGHTNSLNVGGEIWGDTSEVLSGFVMNIGAIAIGYTFCTFASHLLKIACEKWDTARRPTIALKMFKSLEQFEKNNDDTSYVATSVNA